MKAYRMSIRFSLLIALVLIFVSLSTRLRADTGTCGGQTITLPFTDVPSSNIFFCSIAEAFFAGLTNGASPTTYSPSANVPREQMAAFITRTLDQSLKRGSRRAALGQFWTQGSNNLSLTDVIGLPVLVKSDGADLWVANANGNSVLRVRASDGRVLENWTGATGAWGVLCAMGKVFVTGATLPGSLYQIDPAQPAGAVTTLTTTLGDNAEGIAYDGRRIWVASTGGSVSIITLNPTTVTNVSTGFISPIGVLYDGANIWATDTGDNTIKKLTSSGAILQSVPVGARPMIPAFDGTNIWVPNYSSNTVSLVRATGGLAGTVIATLSGNELNGPTTAAFDGERILVTNNLGRSVSLWKASDLSPIGSFSTGAGTFPTGACSDRLNFWIALAGTGKLARF